MGNGIGNLNSNFKFYQDHYLKFSEEGDDFMILELEKELCKLPALKELIKEMGNSLWQGRPWKIISWTWASNAGKRILGRFKKSRRSN